MKKFLKNYGFILAMLTGIVSGCVVGLLWPEFAPTLSPLGELFTNMMFCLVVPMVFCSICSAIANMPSMGRAGKVMGVTIATFLVTAAIASVIMYTIMRLFPIVTGTYDVPQADPSEVMGVGEMVVSFFTKPDFVELLSRRAVLPLIVFAVIIGFGIQMSGGPKTMTAKLLEDITGCIMNAVKIVTYYAPVGFFGFFANLVATYGPELIGDYSRTLVMYYGLSFAYMFIFFPIYARFGGGKGAVKIMFRHLFKPAAVSFGTCSSVATIPMNTVQLIRLIIAAVNLIFGRFLIKVQFCYYSINHRPDIFCNLRPDFSSFPFLIFSHQLINILYEATESGLSV